MKKSNILILSFLAVAVGFTVAYSIQTANRLIEASVKSEMVSGDKSKMTLVSNLAQFSSIRITGDKCAKVFVQKSKTNSQKVWVENGKGDSLFISSSNGTLSILSNLRNEIRVIVIETPSLTSLYTSNPDASIDGFSEDSLSINLSGNSYAILKNGSIAKLSYTGTNNSKMSVYYGSTEVVDWNINLSDNALLLGLSPRSKLTMSVKGNAKVQFAD